MTGSGLKTDLQPLSSPPDWEDQALSWDKLDAIETWLTGPGPDDWPQYVPLAELTLAEGRVQLAERELGALPPTLLDQRLTAAEAGFRRVLRDPEATSVHRTKAEQGLRHLQSLESSDPRVAALPNVRPRSTWGASAPIPSKLTPARQRWSRITIHHSALPSADLARSGESAVAEALRRIQRVHVRQEGYGDIGYHFLIDPTGRVYEGRSLKYQGAHAGGNDNVENIGICLLGDFDHELPDPRAERSLEELVASLRQEHRIPKKALYGHQRFKATQCPGKHLMAWVARNSR